MVRIACLTLAALALAGCSDQPEMWRESEIRYVALDVADSVSAKAIADSDRIAELESRITQLEDRLGTVADLAVSTSRANASLRSTFNSNVDKANEAQRRQRTANGDCGTRVVKVRDGLYQNENIECPE